MDILEWKKEIHVHRQDDVNSKYLITCFSFNNLNTIGKEKNVAQILFQEGNNSAL